jgi:nucleoside 2-deoxyribosyltransferase
MKKVYLAGPTVFLPDADARFSEMKRILLRYGLEGVAPVDNQAGLEGLKPGVELGLAIYDADEALMETVDAAIFNTDPFRRGTEMDAGTAFEIGYCRARRLPMAAWRTDTRDYPKTVKDFIQGVLGEQLSDGPQNSAGGTSGDLRDPDDILVHSEGFYQNLMIDASIIRSGGKSYADPDWTAAFDRASADIARAFRAQE